jgi:predicted permease
MPSIIDRGLSILSGMSLPLALLLIGASLNFSEFAQQFKPVVLIGLIKLVLMPAFGIAFYLLMGVPAPDFVPALILLAAPSATVTYIMATEMGGDPKMASAAVTATTLASLVTYTLWLGFTH